MSTNTLPPLHDRWEQEFHAGHRWGCSHDSVRVSTEHTRLLALWQAIPTDVPPSAPLFDQIIAIEFCNWRLEESLQALCRGIGANEPAPFPIGHLVSVTDERWRHIWAYYLAVRDWQPHRVASGFSALLACVDADGTIRRHVTELLGEQTPLKVLYIERFRLTLDYWLNGWYDMQDGGVIGLRGAIRAIDDEIRKLDPEAETMLTPMVLGDINGNLFPCIHKLFRRYDIILASIGGGRWRAGMPEGGGSRVERVEANERYLTPIAAWLDGTPPKDELAVALHQYLGTRTPTKCFLAALLVSLLRSQLTGNKWEVRS